ERTKIRNLYNVWQMLLSTVKDAETGQRGFLISGDESYLEPFQSAVGQLPQLFQKISLLETENGYDSKVLTNAHKLTDQKLEELRESILIYRREGADAAREIMLTGRGKDLMNQLRTTAGEHINDVEKRMTAWDQA